MLELLAATTGGAFLWDRLCLAVFAPAVFRASLMSARPDVGEMLASMRKGLLWIFTAIFLFGSNFHVAVLLAVYFMYKQGVYSS